MTFDPNGRLTFQGALESFNPGHWEIDVAQHELRIILPNADLDNLQIFKMYLGDGVKAFNWPQKQITYAFDDQTWKLNIAGWIYSKETKAAQEVVPEPELK